MAAARTGDRAAFGRLVETRWERVARLARSIVGDADADDVAQEACVICWRKLSQLADPSCFDAWLMRIVFRRAVRHARWQRMRSVLSLDRGGVAGVERTATPVRDNAVPATDPASDLFVWQLLSRLPPRQRAVVHLTVVEGMTDSEIAQALGIRPGSVRAHRRRAKQAIEAAVRGAASEERSQTSCDAGLECCGAQPRK